MIPEVDTIVPEVEDNVLTTHTITGLAIPMVDAISYMVDFTIMLI